MTRPETAATADALTAALAEAQRIGLIGPGPLELAIEHARRFAALVPNTSRLVIDLGSGGGLPGLVLAVVLPEAVHVVLVDRRERSADFLERAVRSLGLGERTTVVRDDVTAVGRDARWRGGADVVTARGLGPAAEVAELGLPLLRPGGLLVASVAGAGAAWPPELPAPLTDATVLSRDDGFVIVRAGESCPAELPRARRLPPLF